MDNHHFSSFQVDIITSNHRTNITPNGGHTRLPKRSPWAEVPTHLCLYLLLSYWAWMVFPSEHASIHLVVDVWTFGLRKYGPLLQRITLILGVLKATREIFGKGE